MPGAPGTECSTFLNNFESKWVLVSKTIITKMKKEKHFDLNFSQIDTIVYQTIFSAHPGLVAKNKHIFNLCLAGKKIHTSIRKNEGGTKNLSLPYDIQLKMFMSFLKKTFYKQVFN